MSVQSRLPVRMIVYARECGALIVAAPRDGFGLGGDAELGLYPINANIYEPLLRLTADFRPAPSLATRWEFVPPNTWRFHLRRDVRVRWMW